MSRQRKPADAADVARFGAEVRASANRKASLLRRTSPRTGEPARERPPETLEVALEELRVDHEELLVAEEELRVQVEELARANARVDEERKKYADLFRYATDGYIVTDSAGVIREVNLAGAHMLGVEARFLVGKPLAALCTRSDITTLLSAIGLAAAGGSVDRELTFHRRRGGVFDASVRAARLHEPGSLLWTLTERGRVPSERRRSGMYSAFTAGQTDARDGGEITGRAKPSDASATESGVAALNGDPAANGAGESPASTLTIDARFLTVLAHDLRGPLSAVLGWTQLLQRGTIGGDEVPRALSVIERSVRVQLGLIEDILDLARLTTQKLELNAEPLDLTESLRRIAESALPAAQKKGVTLDVLVPATPTPVVADRKRLEQIFTNLLSNATKFTSTGGHVNVSARAEDAEAVIEVRDTGRGIEAAVLPFVFDRHVQDEGVRGTGGLGLGLFIVKQLVELHGGTVTAASEGPGKGAAFTVRLPLRPGYVVPASADVVVAAPSGRELEGRRVVVVDDDDDTREIIAAMLRAHGATSWLAPDIASALALVEAQQPHVIISDIGLRGEDGCALAQQVHERFPATMSIALSGFADVTVRDQAMASGFKRFLSKPVETSALVDAILQSAR